VPSENLDTERHTGRLMLGIFLAPIAAAANAQSIYMLAPFACQSGSKLVLHLFILVALFVAGYGLWVASREWHASGGDWPNEENSAAPRARFLGMFGMLFSGICVALILMQWLPVLLMNPCVQQQSR
jgi:hypothetical protein